MILGTSKEVALILEICLRLPGEGERESGVTALKVISCSITSMDEYSYNCEDSFLDERNEN